VTEQLHVLNKFNDSISAKRKSAGSSVRVRDVLRIRNIKDTT
jgi:hypothetical protein